MSWASLILALAKPLVGRVLLALGMSMVTMKGVDVAVGAFKPTIIGYLSQGPIEALQLAGLAGCWQGLGMIFGAVTFALTMWGIRKATSLIGVGGS